MKKVTLEISLKPFKQTDEEYIRTVCRKIFRQWYPVLKGKDTISVMFWTSDGSEILDYSGNLDNKFEWCYYMGTANKALADESDRPDLSIHEKKRLYMQNPPEMTYRILKKIIGIMKEEGKNAFPEADIRIGETFDIGPEFAVSEFKYSRHREICGRNVLDNYGFVDCTSVLNGDDRKYAAYPDGIPDKTPFGLFLGKQCEIFLKHMGFDYLWLSNGIGFSEEPWELTGKIYDGENFYPERLGEKKKKILQFWKYFREGCPDFPVETRGTNNSAGIDYAADGVPLYDIYNGGFNITPPPNSPWAALNGNLGLELMGHMTRICELPGDEFMFRYYIHDPWWVNSPWYDRYQGQPHDIYLPMAVSRVTKEGKLQSADILNILSVDNSYGDMPDCCVNETVPHLLKAEKNISDAPAPFVWLYPVREYTQAEDKEILKEMYFGDKYVCDSINNGFPLNCVVSTDNFLNHDFEIYKNSIIISPVPIDARAAEKLNGFAENGGKIIIYGSTDMLNKCAVKNAVMQNTQSGEFLTETVKRFGWYFEFDGKTPAELPPTYTINRSNNAFWFAEFSRNTTITSRFRFPLGAPVFMAGETLIKDGFATYHMARSEYRECRIFVKQDEGVVGAAEIAPVNYAIKRRIVLKGLKNAEVCFFPETYAAENTKINHAILPDITPDYLPDWTVVNDENGRYIRAENVSGDIEFVMPRKEFLGKL